MYYNDRSIEEMADNLDDEKIISLIIDGVFEWVIAYGEDEKNINLSNLEIKEKLNKIKAYSRKLIALKEILNPFRFKTNIDNLFDLGLKKMLKQD
jgi:hypothetical protein